VRDFDGDPARTPAPLPPIAVTVDEQFAIGSGGTLRIVSDADEWDSTISFAAGIPVTLGGTLELGFAADVDLASQIGRTLDLFDWTGVTPTGTFAVSSQYPWDLSQLYTTGEVTLLSPFTPGDANGDQFVDRADAAILAQNLGLTTGALWSHGDFDNSGTVDLADAAILQSHLGASPMAPSAAAIPEPSTFALATVGLFGMLVGVARRSPKFRT
jgi:hypothetical protein